METVPTSETSIYFHETIQSYIPEDCHLEIPICTIWFNKQELCILSAKCTKVDEVFRG
jgi:hypothetical protein